MIKTFSMFLLFLISSSVSAQGVYTYVEAKDLNEYGIELHVEKEEDVGRWCLDFIYPKIMKGDEYKVFQHSSYLLKHEYLTTAIDKAPAQYFDLASKEISNISEKLKTDFCIAKEFLIGAEVQLFYEHKPKKLGFEQTEIIWIQNIDKILFEN